MNEPLAQRLRPKTLADVCGQQHLLAPGHDAGFYRGRALRQCHERAANAFITDEPPDTIG